MKEKKIGNKDINMIYCKYNIVYSSEGSQIVGSGIDW